MPFKWELWAFLSILSFWRKRAFGSPTNRLPLVWEKSSNRKWLKMAFEKKKRPSTGIPRGNFSRRNKCFFFALSQHAILVLDLRAPRPARLVTFGSFAKACDVQVCHGKFFCLGFLLFLERQGAHEYYSLTKIRSAPHFLQPPAIDKEPESDAKCLINQMAIRCGAKKKF